MMQKSNYYFKVRNYHIDSYGHVNSAKYMNFLEDARTVFLEEMGFRNEDLLREKLFIFLADIEIKFKKPALLGDQLVIYSWHDEIKKVRLRWKQEIINVQTGELIAEVRTSAAFLKDGKLIPIPPNIREKMLLYLETLEESGGD
jgi:YbgC/YbaW family acyl-CoA thioester hydrolase